MRLKKYVIFAIALAACAGGAFAQISIGGGVDMTVVPLQVVTRDTAEGEGNVWLGSGMGTGAAQAGIRTRLIFSANHEDRFGFRTDIWYLFSNDGANLWSGRNPNAMEVRLGDNGHLWMTPTDWFRLDVGRIWNFSQAGYINDHWLSLWTVGMFNGDQIFTSHFSGGIGVLARFTPPQVEGLSAYVFLPQFGMPFMRDDRDFAWLPCGLLVPGSDTLNSDDEGANMQRAFRVFQRTWLTVGYRFADVLHARVQFAGANPSGNINWTAGESDSLVDVSPYRWRMAFNAPRFEAALAYVTRSLVLDLGFRAWLPVSEWITDTWNVDPNNPGYLRGGHPGSFWGGIGFGFGASFLATEDFRVSFRADGDMLRTWTGPYRGVERITNPTRLSFQLWPAYTLNNGVTLMLAAGLNYVGRNTVEMVDGTDPNDDNLDWERSDRLRFGVGFSATIPFFANSHMNIGLTYRHGTADIRGGEPRVVTVPIHFFFHW